jgi:hypothetical protein
MIEQIADFSPPFAAATASALIPLVCDTILCAQATSAAPRTLNRPGVRSSEPRRIPNAIPRADGGVMIFTFLSASIRKCDMAFAVARFFY